MESETYYVIGAAIASIVVVLFLYGFVKQGLELKTTWSNLRNHFGVPGVELHTRQFDSWVLGKMRLLDVEYVGRAEVSRDGVVFGRQFTNHREFLLLGWADIEKLEVDESSPSAKLTVRRGSDVLIQLSIPWTSEMTRSANGFGQES